MIQDSFGKSIIKSLLYAFLGGIISFITALTTVIILSSVSYSVLDKSITHLSYWENYRFFEPIIKLYLQYDYRFFVIPMAVVVSLISIVSFVVALQIFNPNFSLRYLKQNKINQWRLILFFVLSLIIIGMFAYALSFVSSLLASFVSLMMFLFLWHEQGIWGDLKTFSIKEKISLNLIKKFILPVVIITVWLHFIRLMAGYLFDHNPYFVSYEAPWVNYLFYILLFLNICFISRTVELPIYYLVRDLNLSSRQILPRLIIPLLLTIVLIVALFVNGQFISQYDYDKSFIEETGVDLTLTDHKTIIVLDSNQVMVIPVDYQPNLMFGQVIFSTNFLGEFWESDSVDLYQNLFDPSLISQDNQIKVVSVSCHEDNLERVKEYGQNLAIRDYQSFLSYPYFDYLYQCSKQNWELGEYFQNSYLALEKTNIIIQGAILTSRQSMMAYNNQKLVELIDQINKDNYHIGADGYQRIDEIRQYYSASDKFIGRITGQVIIDNLSPSDIKVGLLSDDKTIGLPVRNYEQRLVAALAPDKEGKFEFYNIAQGKYTLAVMINKSVLSEDDLSINAEKSLSEIKIDKNNTKINIGKIIVKTK